MVKYVRRCALVLGLLLFGQLSGKAQTFALKTDVLNWATASFNIEPEVRVGDNWKSHATLTPLAKQDCPPLATI